MSDAMLMSLPARAKMPHHAKTEPLGTQFSIASLGGVLPRIKQLTANDILEVRDKMRNDVRALNATLLGYAGKLRDRVGEEPSLEVLQ